MTHQEHLCSRSFAAYVINEKQTSTPKQNLYCTPMYTKCICCFYLFTDCSKPKEKKNRSKIIYLYIHTNKTVLQYWTRGTCASKGPFYGVEVGSFPDLAPDFLASSHHFPIAVQSLGIQVVSPSKIAQLSVQIVKWEKESS